MTQQSPWDNAPKYLLERGWSSQLDVNGKTTWTHPEIDKIWPHRTQYAAMSQQLFWDKMVDLDTGDQLNLFMEDS